MSDLDAVLSHIDEHLDDSLDRLFTLLKFESISTDPAYKPECAMAANWLVDELNSLGYDATAHKTPGHPMVVAHGEGEGPHLLFYGHYDVQPVDPLNLWNSKPFEPRIETREDGTKLIRARGAADDKGQLMTFVEAVRAWKAAGGGVPAKLTFLFEGEEESGSPSLVPFMEKHREELKCDLALVCDTGMWDPETPAISTMLRGLCGDEVIIHAASRDLHSGMYGGIAANPIRVLAKILAALHDENGRITLPGFYDGVPDLPEAIAEQWKALDFKPEKFLGEVGLAQPAGEKSQPGLNQIWARPTCEFNGITGGYTGEGFKTVIPAEARAKVSFRLVGDQDPHAVRAAFRAHVEAMLPADCSAEFIRHGSGKATVMPTTAPAFAAAQKALSEEWAKDAAFIGCGGSIPIVGHFQKILGMQSLLIGFGLDDDNLHSPNEKYDLKSFHKGIRSWARVLGALGR